MIWIPMLLGCYHYFFFEKNHFSSVHCCWCSEFCNIIRCLDSEGLESLGTLRLAELRRVRLCFPICFHEKYAWYIACAMANVMDQCCLDVTITFFSKNHFSMVHCCPCSEFVVSYIVLIWGFQELCWNAGPCWSPGEHWTDHIVYEMGDPFFNGC